MGTDQRGNIWKLSISSVYFFYQLKIALRNKDYNLLEHIKCLIMILYLLCHIQYNIHVIILNYMTNV